MVGVFAEYFGAFWRNHKFYLIVDEQWRRQHKLFLLGYALAWITMPGLLVEAFVLKALSTESGVLPGSNTLFLTRALLDYDLSHIGKFDRYFGWLAFAVGLGAGIIFWIIQ